MQTAYEKYKDKVKKAAAIVLSRELNADLLLTAFTNTKGGYVFVGVADSGKIVGVQLGNETIPQWLNQIKTNTFPTLIPDVATAAIDHKDVAIFMVDEFPIKPVSCRGKYLKTDRYTF